MCNNVNSRRNEQAVNKIVLCDALVCQCLRGSDVLEFGGKSNCVIEMDCRTREDGYAGMKGLARAWHIKVHHPIWVFDCSALLGDAL